MCCAVSANNFSRRFLASVAASSPVQTAQRPANHQRHREGSRSRPPFTPARPTIASGSASSPPRRPVSVLVLVPVVYVSVEGAAVLGPRVPASRSRRVSPAAPAGRSVAPVRWGFFRGDKVIDVPGFVAPLEGVKMQPMGYYLPEEVLSPYPAIYLPQYWSPRKEVGR